MRDLLSPKNSKTLIPEEVYGFTDITEPARDQINTGF
jgi:hypothetical protein